MKTRWLHLALNVAVFQAAWFSCVIAAAQGWPVLAVASVAAALALHLAVSAPNQIFIRGRGLDVEMGGSLLLTGTADDVRPVGAFQLVRGRLSVLGQRLTFTSGTVSLTGTTATYTPASGYFGSDSFTFTATGPGGTSSSATVSLTVATPPPPVVTPPTTPVVVTPPSGGGNQPVTVDLGARTTGVLDGYRVEVNAQHGTATITVVNAAPLAQNGGGGTGPQGAEVFQLVYTPAANFMGTDTVTVVAYGPGGDSAPAVFTFQVPGKAPDLSASTASNRRSFVAPTSITMSTSSAPSATACAASAALIDDLCFPDGKPTTVATLSRRLPCSSTGISSGRNDGETQTA